MCECKCVSMCVELVYKFSMGERVGGQIQHNSYVQTAPNRRRLLIIDDKSLPQNIDAAFTRLLKSLRLGFRVFEPLDDKPEVPGWPQVIGNTQGVHGEVTLIIELDDKIVSIRSLSSTADPPAARELSVNPKKSWSLNFRLNLKIANFRVHLYGAYRRR